MASVPICSKLLYKDYGLPVSKWTREKERDTIGDCISPQEAYKCFPSIPGDSGEKWHVYTTNNFLMKRKKIQTPLEVSVLRRVYNIEGEVKYSSEDASQRDKPCTVSYESESNANERQLKALDSYFSKLQDKVKDLQTSSISSTNFESVTNIKGSKMETSSEPPDKMEKSLGRNDQFTAKKGLSSLQNYLEKLQTGVDSQKNILSNFEEEATKSNPVRIPHSSRDNIKSEERNSNSAVQLEIENVEGGPTDSQGLLPYDETSDLYLVCILASINIAVFIFEIASPVKNSELELLSLPSLYGAKINQLILVGEWWRLVTPMFLHYGFPHVALGCWVLLTFGPQVCRGYGSFTFFLIYLLGGICGNLTSFVHTPDPTVGGTGPVFAIVGAWLIYQIQNKDVIMKEVSERMFQKAVIATALSCVLTNFGPIDEWTNFAAACSGVIYGFLTCPTLQLDNPSSENRKEEGLALVRHYSDPCKSLILFTLFIVVLSSLLFFVEPPVNTMEVHGLV